MDVDKATDCLLITANCGSVFEDPSRLLKNWISEFLSHVITINPKFIALHLQEVGGKTYEKSLEYVQEFIKILCESEQLEEYKKIRVFLDEDYKSAEHFTELGNLYFIHNSIVDIKIWNFLTHSFESVDGKTIHTGNIESVAIKEKAKFPQNFFPECKWSRKGFLRTRWIMNGSTFDLINIHLFHDASNLAACEQYPSVYCKNRRRALLHTLERFHKDPKNLLVPFFIFGDFNFRCDTEGVIKNLTQNLIEQRIPNVKADNTKVQFCDADGSVKLTVGKKEFLHVNHNDVFKEKWMHDFDRELEPFQDILHEFPLQFAPSYPFEEDPQMPHNYMSTRCPAWCDRILMSKAAVNLIEDVNKHEYGIIGDDVCMGDHKPVYLKVRMKSDQGIVNKCDHNNHFDDDYDDDEDDDDSEKESNKENLSNHKKISKRCLMCLKHFNAISERLNASLSSASFTSLPVPQVKSQDVLSRDDSTPLVSISVVDADNLNVCMCNSISDESRLREGKMCKICRNIIKRQPQERNTLVSQQTMFGDVIVNRIDSQHHLTSTYASNLLQIKKLGEPYTPESIESHSPQPEMDEKYFTINDTIEGNEKEAENETTTVDVKKRNNFMNDDKESAKCDRSSIAENLHAQYKFNHTVTPIQLTTRLEILRRESQLMINDCDFKNRSGSGSAVSDADIDDDRSLNKSKSCLRCSCSIS